MSQFISNSSLSMSIFRVLGLSVIKGIQRDLLSGLFNLSWIFINIGTVTLLALKSDTFAMQNFTKMSDIIDMTNYFLALSTNIVILIHTFLVQTVDISWHKKYDKVESMLRDYDRDEINRIKSHQQIKILIVLFLCAFCNIINFCFALERESETVFNILFNAHFYTLKTVINLRYIQHTIRIDAISQCLSILSRTVHEVSQRNTITWKIVLVNEDEKLSELSRRRVPLTQKIDDTREILIFKSIYSGLFEVMKLLENIFGWSFLAMISFTFIDLTSNLYWFTLAVIGLGTSVEATNCIIEIISSLIVVNCLMFSSFSANRRSKEVINAAIKLFTNTTSTYNRMVKEFLLQMHHERIENSANDFFVVDFHLSPAVSGNLDDELTEMN